MTRTGYISLRTKLIGSFIVVIILGGILTLIIGSKIVENTIISQAKEKIKYDLQTAWIIYNQKLNLIYNALILTAGRESLRDSIIAGDMEKVKVYLKKLKSDMNLDILDILDEHGNVILRIDGNTTTGDRITNPLVELSLKGEPSKGNLILKREEIAKENPELVEKAYIKEKKTPMSSSSSLAEPGSGLFQMASVPIKNEYGKVVAIIYGGVLINKNYEIVDRIKAAVYRDEKYNGLDVGTATIFLKNLRISTNVTESSGERAIGTLLSDEVKKAVLDNHQRWIGRAFVVRSWYITAYDPIKDARGEIAGILYVGILEKPYLDAKWRVMFTFTAIACGCVVLLLVILYFSTTRIVRPLRNMVEATQRISSGDLSHRLKVTSKDEVGYLAECFNRMTENLEEANKKLIEYGKNLEKKVEERTKELKKMQANLIQSEKLASLGKLSASIAHEINNPLGGILIYAHLLLEDLKEGDPARENIEKIIKETTRCKNIVKDLLEFARPKEPKLESVNIHDIIDKALDLVTQKAEFQNVSISKNFSNNIPNISVDKDQLLQVFVNIIMNACEAMKGNGKLTLKTSYDKEWVTTEVIDSGCGMNEEVRKKIFEPFFTTKEVGKGTGLGLAVSYGIITRHGGKIEVESEPGKGANFRIILPVEGNKAKTV